MLKALTVLIKNVPKQMSEWLPQILPPVWSTLTTSGITPCPRGEYYKKKYIFLVGPCFLGALLTQPILLNCGNGGGGCPPIWNIYYGDHSDIGSNLLTRKKLIEVLHA